MKPGKKNKGVNKDAKIFAGRSTTGHNLLFCFHVGERGMMISLL